MARESTQVAGQQIAPYVNQATIVTQAQQGLENACMKNEKCKGRRRECVRELRERGALWELI